MKKTIAGSVDDYIASQPEAARAPLRRVRRSIRKALPGADEVISYGIPAYRLQGRAVLYFAGWTEHYSLYPSTTRLATAFKEALAPYAVSKGTIRFPLSEQVPVTLIERIARFKAKEVADRPTGTRAAKKRERRVSPRPEPARRAAADPR